MLTRVSGYQTNKQKASFTQLILGFEILNTTIQRFSIVFALTAFETIQISEKISGHYRAHCLVLVHVKPLESMCHEVEQTVKTRSNPALSM